MRYKRITRLSLVCLMFSLLAVDSSRAIENVRVAYPSMGTSVFCLIIAQKEGYLKEEGLEAVAAVRARRNETNTSAHELFARCAKSLVYSGAPGEPKTTRFRVAT